MATQVQFRGGTSEETSTFTGADREITVDTTTKSLRVHDGVTPGGHSPVVFGTEAGMAVEGDDIRLSDSRTPKGEAGGVLSGSYPNPTFSVEMATKSELNAVIATKVDKVEGKQLSTEDFTSDEKSKLASFENYVDLSLQAGLDAKVDKVEGKQLSTEDFTTAEKDKLENLDAAMVAYGDGTVADKLDGIGSGGTGGGSVPVEWIEGDGGDVPLTNLSSDTMYILDVRSGNPLGVYIPESHSSVPVGSEYHFVCAGDPENAYIYEDIPAPLSCDVILSWENQKISSPILTSWQEGVGVFNYNSEDYPDPVGEWVGGVPTPIQSITITASGDVFITLNESPAYSAGYYLHLTNGNDEWYFDQIFGSGSDTTELHLTGPTLSEEVFDNAQMCLRIGYSVLA